ncbi:MAG: hypothetical protein AAGI48_03830 [Verrucomicrobiota bacterium]
MGKKGKVAAAIAASVALNSRLNDIAAAPVAPADDGGFKHDRIVAANASLFTESYFSEPLTTYAVGFRDPNNIEETLEFFAPAVQVPRRFEHAVHNNAEEFYSEDDDERAIRADFGEVEYTEDKVDAKTVNRGLKICVDLDEVADKDNWREHYTGKLLRRLNRNSLRRAIALLSAAATNTAKTWDSSAGKDPDQDVSTELIAAATASGVRPNRVGYGDTAYSKRITSHRAQDNAGGYASAGLTLEQLASFLNVDQTFVSRERYSTGGDKQEVVNNLVLMFMAMSGQDQEDPSNIKRFWSPTESGGRVRVYEREVSAKLYEIVVEHYELTKITSMLGIRKFTVS